MLLSVAAATVATLASLASCYKDYETAQHHTHDLHHPHHTYISELLHQIEQRNKNYTKTAAKAQHTGGTHRQRTAWETKGGQPRR